MGASIIYGGTSLSPRFATREELIGACCSSCCAHGGRKAHSWLDQFVFASHAWIDVVVGDKSNNLLKLFNTPFAPLCLVGSTLTVILAPKQDVVPILLLPSESLVATGMPSIDGTLLAGSGGMNTSVRSPGFGNHPRPDREDQISGASQQLIDRFPRELGCSSRWRLGLQEVGLLLLSIVNHPKTAHWQSVG